MERRARRGEVGGRLTFGEWFRAKNTPGTDFDGIWRGRTYIEDTYSLHFPTTSPELSNQKKLLLRYAHRHDCPISGTVVQNGACRYRGEVKSHAAPCLSGGFGRCLMGMVGSRRNRKSADDNEAGTPKGGGMKSVHDTLRAFIPERSAGTRLWLSRRHGISLRNIRLGCGRVNYACNGAGEKAQCSSNLNSTKSISKNFEASRFAPFASVGLGKARSAGFFGVSGGLVPSRFAVCKSRVPVLNRIRTHPHSKHSLLRFCLSRAFLHREMSVFITGVSVTDRCRRRNLVELH